MESVHEAPVTVLDMEAEPAAPSPRHPSPPECSTSPAKIDVKFRSRSQDKSGRSKGLAPLSSSNQTAIKVGLRRCRYLWAQRQPLELSCDLVIPALMFLRLQNSTHSIRLRFTASLRTRAYMQVCFHSKFTEPKHAPD
eukprot:1327206-Rhodomonas_salina.1